ncbi:hypothetical protein DFP72DRAFT_907672 [Ephemerocybe angulata]|uniref:Uncharacterized protein n=1 Tax=Ephemerocybe angulata TaxID=980116 RepID=A0A8H6M334_9AGAR|nr:hypothetical protein DFP72DRAFT_907672 [Tulosesus angulatus]
MSFQQSVNVVVSEICAAFHALIAVLVHCWATLSGAWGAPSEGYHDLKTPAGPIVPLPAQVDGVPTHGDDLESGLLAMTKISPLPPGDPQEYHDIPLNSSPPSPLLPSTPVAPHPILTSSILSPFIMHGSSLSVSESAKALLLLSQLGSNSTGQSDAETGPSRGPSYILAPDHGDGAGILSLPPSPSPQRCPLFQSSSHSPSSYSGESASIIHSCPSKFDQDLFYTSPTTATHQSAKEGAGFGLVDKGVEEVKSKVVPRTNSDGSTEVRACPRPPSSVRRSLRLSTHSPHIPGTFSAPAPPPVPQIPDASLLLLKADSAHGQNDLPLGDTSGISPTQSVASFLSQPGGVDILRGAVLTSAEDIRLPSSLSAPEARYYEFYYDIYCQPFTLQTIMPLDDHGAETRLSKSSTSLPECTAAYADESPPMKGPDDDHSMTYVVQSIEADGPDSPRTLWGSPFLKSTPKFEHSFILPPIPLTSTAISMGTLIGHGEDELDYYGLQDAGEQVDRDDDNQDGNDSNGSNASTTRYYSSGSRSQGYSADADTTLLTTPTLNPSKRLSGSSVSTCGSDDAEQEAILVEVKRGSLAKPVFLLQNPGKWGSVRLSTVSVATDSRSLHPAMQARLRRALSNGKSQHDRLSASDSGLMSSESFRSVNESFTDPEKPSSSEDSGLGMTMEGIQENEVSAEEAGDVSPGSGGKGSSEAGDEGDSEWLSWPSKNGIKGTHRMSLGIANQAANANGLTIFNANHRRPQTGSPTTIPRQHHLTRHPTLQANIRHLVVSHTHDFLPAKLPNYHNGLSLDDTTEESNGSFTTNASRARSSSILVQMDISFQNPNDPPQGSGDEGAALTCTESRYPKFIPLGSGCPSKRLPKRPRTLSAPQLPDRSKSEDRDRDDTDERDSDDDPSETVPLRSLFAEKGRDSIIVTPALAKGGDCAGSENSREPPKKRRRAATGGHGMRVAGATQDTFVSSARPFITTGDLWPL